MLHEYGERRVATVLLTPGAIAELFISPAKGTWSIVRSTPQGAACMASYGVWPFGTAETVL